MPSLDQLAARVGPSASAMSPASGNRPRLATSLLARSTSSINSQATAASGDSTAVNPPDSPTGSITPATDSSTGAVPNDSTDDGVVAALDKLDLTDPQRKAARGYKNVPSLEAITERFKRQQSHGSVASSSGASTPDKERTKEEALLQVPAAPAAPSEASKEHPLQNKWSVPPLVFSY